MPLVYKSTTACAKSYGAEKKTHGPLLPDVLAHWLPVSPQPVCDNESKGLTAIVSIRLINQG